jgi:hypothetical protein
LELITLSVLGTILAGVIASLVLLALRLGRIEGEVSQGFKQTGERLASIEDRLVRIENYLLGTKGKKK